MICLRDNFDFYPPVNLELWENSQGAVSDWVQSQQLEANALMEYEHIFLSLSVAFPSFSYSFLLLPPLFTSLSLTFSFEGDNNKILYPKARK